MSAEIKKLAEDYRGRILSGETLTIEELREGIKAIRVASTSTPAEKKMKRTTKTNEDLMKELGL